MDCTVPHKGAQSLVTSASMPNWLRASKIVQPWRPISPLTMTASPGRAWAPDKWTPSVARPMPVVVMNRPSTCPLPATFVSPATMRTPASAAVSAIAAAYCSTFAKGKPSSRTKAQVIYRGFAPMQARSLTVPQMLSLPMLPPGNSGGDTMNPSVVKARFAPPTDKRAASSAVNSGLEK